MAKREMQTMDGNNAAAHVSYAFTDLAAYLPHHPVVSYGRGDRLLVHRRG